MIEKINTDNCGIVLDGRGASDRSDYEFDLEQPPPVNISALLKVICAAQKNYVDIFST